MKLGNSSTPGETWLHIEADRIVKTKG